MLRMPDTSLPLSSTVSTLYLGGGCFWCTEAVFGRIRGVLQVRSGYANGKTAQTSYLEVCRDNTGHAEVIEVVFDTKTIDLPALLAIFFASHDPTTLNRQGNDVGTQYRSAIYTTSAEQLAQVQALVTQLERSGHWGAPIVTEVAPLTAFCPAEPEHDQYFARNPHQGYCAWVIAPKVEKIQQTFSAWVRAEADPTSLTPESL